MIKNIASIVFFIFHFSMFSQVNLIPNPSFENHKKKIAGISGTSDDFDNSIFAWYSPTEATPDIYIKNVAIDWWSKKNGWGIDSVYDKNAMLGLILYSSSDKCLTYREYAQCKLRAKFEKGKQYRLTLKIKLSAHSSAVCNNLGIFFSLSHFRHKSTCSNFVVNNMLKIDTLLGKDKKWKEVIFEFEALDTFRYLTVGNFYNNKETKYERVKSDFEDKSMAYYYFDDFNLSLVTKDTLVKRTEKVKENFKEVFNPTNIFFDFDKANINEQSAIEIDKIAAYLMKNESKMLVIHGFTDSKGKEAYNIKLSELRACNIKAYLIQKGVLDNRLQCIGHGEDNNSTTEATQRKVEFELK